MRVEPDERRVAVPRGMGNRGGRDRAVAADRHGRPVEFSQDVSQALAYELERAEARDPGALIVAGLERHGDITRGSRRKVLADGGGPLGLAHRARRGRPLPLGHDDEGDRHGHTLGAAVRCTRFDADVSQRRSRSSGPAPRKMRHRVPMTRAVTMSTGRIASG